MGTQSGPALLALDALRPVHLQLCRARFRCGHERVVRKMRVAGGAGDADVTQQLPDRVKVDPGIDHEAGCAVPQVV